MRLHWLFLISALGLAACQPREPSAPQGPKTAEAPPAATAALPPPSVQPPPATGACPPQPQATCPPPVRAAASGRQARVVRARADRPSARVQRATRDHRAVDIPPEGGYRYDDLQDDEIERRYLERRYEAERRAHERYEVAPPPAGHAWRERDDYDHRRGRYGYGEDRLGNGYSEESRDEAWRDRERYAYERREDRYSGGPPMRRERPYEARRYDHDGSDHAHDGYAGRRSGHVTEVVRGERGGVRRYEERTHGSGVRASEHYSERRAVAAGGCCIVGHVPPAAGRDANGFLTWPGKVPAVP